MGISALLDIWLNLQHYPVKLKSISSCFVNSIITLKHVPVTCEWKKFFSNVYQYVSVNSTETKVVNVHL